MRRVALAVLCGLALGIAQAAPLRYAITIEIDDGGEIVGQVTMSGVALGDWPEAVVRLYPAAFGADRLSVTGAWVEGEAVSFESVEATTATVALVATAGQTFSLTLGYRGTVPEFAQAGGYGSYARSGDAVVLTQAYPILSPWDGAWVAHPVFPWGDAIVAEVADYEVDLSVPAGWVVVAGGVEVEVAPGQYRVEGENLRELAIVLVRGHEVQTASVSGVEVRSFYRPEHDCAGRAALAVTADAIAAFVDRLGPPPFSTLDVVSVPLRGVAGIEYPGLILVGETYYNRYPLDPLFFPMIFAHEVAHQWWYAEVGNDQVAEPWVDEALATYTSGLYFAAQGRFAEILRYWESGYAAGRLQNRTAGIASPLWEFPGGSGYGGIVYSGGALFLHAVRERMGDDAFFGALRRYRDEFRWRLATGADLLRILSDGSAIPLDDLLKTWLGF